MSEHLDSGQLSRLIDGDLSLTSRSAARAHLEECPVCAQRHDALIAAAALLRQLPPVDWSETHSDAVLAGLDERPARRRGLVLGVLVACAAVLGGVLAALPVIQVGLELGQVVGTVSSELAPRLLVGAVPQLVVIAAVAILAPLAAYPLARWR